MSKGTAGEEFAEIYFRQIGWHMERHQPESRVVYSRGKPVVMYARSTGIADYTGYEMVVIGGVEVPVFRACEVKEAVGNTMPCSRLGAHQRDWMERIPWQSAYTGIYWRDLGKFELHKYKQKGSYKYGECVKYEKNQVLTRLKKK